MGERDDARHQVEQTRERVSRIAHEVSRRMTPAYAKERARDMARERAIRMREDAVESTWFGPVVGAAVGALVAKALQARAQERGYGRAYYERYYDDERYPRRYGYAGYRDEYWTDAEDEARSGLAPEQGDRTAAMKERAAEMKDQVSAKASDVKDQVSAKASDVKDRVVEQAGELKDRAYQQASALRERMPSRERIRASARDDTTLWAFGAMAIGALFGLALPVSQGEREMLEPARRKARELGQQAKDLAMEKGRAVADQAIAATEGHTQEHGQEGVGTQTTGTTPLPGSPTPIH